MTFSRMYVMVRGATAKSALCNEKKQNMNGHALIPFSIGWSVGPPLIEISGWFGRHSCAQKMNLIDFGDPNSACSATTRLASLALSKMPHQLLSELLRSLVQTFRSPSR